MFICDACGQPSEPGTKMNKIIVELRELKKPDGNTRLEIAKEGKICTRCANRKQPRKQTHKKPYMLRNSS
jgi:hypothetical protein